MATLKWRQSHPPKSNVIVLEHKQLQRQYSSRSPLPITILSKIAAEVTMLVDSSWCAKPILLQYILTYIRTDKLRSEERRVGKECGYVRERSPYSEGCSTCMHC